MAASGAARNALNALFASPTGLWTDTEDRILGSDRVERAQWSRAIHRDVSASPGRQLEVAPKDRTAHLRIDLFKAHYLTPSASKLGLTPSSTNIGDPVHVLTEHCYEIALALVVRDHDGERDQSTAAAPAHLKAV
jgi:hypothetical protein